MGLTLYGANLYQDRVLGSEDPLTVHIGLVLTIPNYLSTGSTIDEPVGNNYARVEVNNDEAQWGLSADGLKANVLPIVFPTATGTWGTVRAWCILDSSSGGNLIAYGVITSQLIAEGATPSFQRDQLSLSAR